MTGRLTRRLKTIPAIVIAAVTLLVTLPVTMPLAMVIDGVRWLLSRRPFMSLRILLFSVVYAWAETVGIAGAAIIAVLPRSQRLRAASALQTRWALTLLTGVKGIFGLRIQVTGNDQIAPGPLVVLARHASLVDNLLPATLITDRHSIRLRYVLKSELLMDPAIDVVGNLLPNAFVDRSGESERAIAQISALSRDLATDEGVLIFPEGTRFSPEKLARSRKTLGRRHPRLAPLASDFSQVLPPRPTGTLAILDSTSCDVLVLAHRGLGGFATLADVWKGAMVSTQVDVAFWRIPRSDIPDQRADRVAWLFETWLGVDQWIARTERSPS